MELSVFSCGQALPRRLRPYHVDGYDTVGAFGDEPFSIRLVNQYRFVVAVRVAVDGRDIASGQPASLDPRDGVPVFTLQPGQVHDFRSWIETARSGAAFVFSSDHLSVAANLPASPLVNGLGKPSLLSVAVYYDPARQGSAYRRPRFPLPTIGYYPERGDQETAKSISLGDTPGVGAGPTVYDQAPDIADPADLTLRQVVEVRYMWYDDLVARLSALGVQPPVRQLADLGGVPRLPAGRPSGVQHHEPIQAYPRIMEDLPG